MLLCDDKAFYNNCLWVLLVYLLNIVNGENDITIVNDLV